MSKKEMRELDAWIAEHVFGWKWEPYDDNAGRYLSHPDGVNYGVQHWNNRPPTYFENLPGYFTDPAAAMQVLEKCAERLGPIPIITSRQKEVGGFWIRAVPENGKHVEGIAETLPLAIALFAKALYSK